MAVSSAHNIRWKLLSLLCLSNFFFVVDFYVWRQTSNHGWLMKNEFGVSVCALLSKKSVFNCLKWVWCWAHQAASTKIKSSIKINIDTHQSAVYRTTTRHDSAYLHTFVNKDYLWYFLCMSAGMSTKSWTLVDKTICVRGW